jgi:hypothetical protein
MSCDLSAIILSYNTQALTCACVKSVLADASHLSHTIEIIVVDNASTDDTAATLRREFPTVHVIVNATNLGFARGNNIGLAAAQGRYLLLLNSDTEVQPGALGALIEFMEAHPEAGACGPQLLNPDGTVQPSGRSLPSVWSVLVGMTKIYWLWKRDFYAEGGRNYQQVRQVGEVSGAALLVRREVYHRVGGLDPNFFAYYEDVDWCKRIGEAGFAVYYVPAARIVHHWKSTSQSVSELPYRAGQNSLRYYFVKHHGPLAQCLIQIMLAGKEIAYTVVCALRRDDDQRRFHQRMLANLKRQLPPSARRTKGQL